MSDTDETTAPGYPDGFEFRLSPDQRQFAVWEPGNQPWFIPVAGMQGRFVESAEMDELGWTRFLPLPQVPPTVRERQALLEENAYLHTVASGAENVRQAWRERAEALEREVAAARKFAAEMRDFCSPHGVSVAYADQLVEAMDRAKEQPVRIRIENSHTMGQVLGLEDGE